MNALKRKPPKLSEEATKNFKEKKKQVDEKVKRWVEKLRKV